MRTSKYVGMRSGEYECVDCVVARVQPVYTNKKDEDGKKIKSKRPGHRLYAYIWERMTSDGKAMKIIRLNAKQVRQVLDGSITVEQVALAREEMREAGKKLKTKHRVSYSFCD
jgi:hypothetical protein